MRCVNAGKPVKMPSNKLSQLEAVLEQLNRCKGQLIQIQEHITRVPGNLNRHVSSQSVLVFELESVGITTSGAHLSLWGSLAGRQLSYQIASDRLNHIEIQTEQVYTIEELAPVCERHSYIRHTPLTISP